MGSGFKKVLGKLFGGGGDSPPVAERREATDYKGYSIRPTPRKQASGWLIAGVISKELPDGVKEYPFIRADTFAAADDAAAFAVTKAKQIIDEQGDRMFDSV